MRLPRAAGHSITDEAIPEKDIRHTTSWVAIPMGILFSAIAGLTLLWRKPSQLQPIMGLEDIAADYRVMLAAAAAVEETETETETETEAEKETEAEAKKPATVQKRLKPKGSKRRRALEALYERKRLYPLEEALQLAKDSSSAKFAETIELAVNLGVDPRKADQMVRGSVVLPAGTGKVVRVAAFCQGDAQDKAKAAGAEFCGLQDLADLIKGGELGFDVVVATPDAMRVALQLGRILGPRGLMPNPKDGTVNVDIEAAIRNAKAGQVKYRCDKGGVVHCPVGKSNFDVEKLKANVDAMLKELLRVKPASVKGALVKKVVVSPTMGPGIYVDISSTAAAQ